MRVRTGQDFWSGVLFVVIGIGALWTIHFYDRMSMGTPQRPGTGVLPEILSFCLLGSGGLLIFKAVATGDVQVSGWAWRPVIAVTLATVAFGLLIDDLGLVAAMVISLTLCALGTPETRWPEYLMFLLIMLAIGVGTFIWLLGMPIPILPVRVPFFLTSILR